MEKKCEICGAINDENAAFCSGCYLPLHKTLDEWARALEERVNSALQIDEGVLENVIDEKEEKEIVETTDAENVWGNDASDETFVKKEEAFIEPVPNIDIPIDTTGLVEPEEEQNIEPAVEEIAPVKPVEPVPNIEPEEKQVTPVVEEPVSNIEQAEPVIEQNVEVNDESSSIEPTTSFVEMSNQDDSEKSEEHDDLRAVTIEEDEEHVKKEKIKEPKVKKPLSYIIKFDLIFIILSLVFTYGYGIVYGFEINNSIDILVGALSTLVIAVMTVFIVFNKPVSEEINQKRICNGILISMIIFEFALRIFLLYKSSFAFIYVYIFIAMVYLLISILTINIISKKINNFDTSKYVSKLNIIALIFIVILLGLGILAKVKDIKLGYDEEPKSSVSVEEIPDVVKNYIASVNNHIVTNMQNDENYQRPTNIKDKDFVESDKNITNVDLIVDDYGTVKTGNITYKGVTYIYQEGSFMVKK